MKKATQARPNVRLKEARELRGWSQKFVADEIGADRYYLSRWEHGTASPSPYYRQKLCALFGLNARELGLLQEDTPVRAKEAAREEQPAWVTAAAHPGVIYDPAIPPFVVGAKGLVGRDEVLQQIKKRLCSGQGLASSALHGLPGVGKTSLAATLAQDPDVLEHFSDGVLWVGLGPTPNVLSLLSRWGMLLGLSSAEIAWLSTVEEWTSALRMVIGSRRLLLVIDDAWRIEAAQAFQVGGMHCAYLVTTRFPQIALRFAGDGTIVVRELDEEEGVTLLARFAPALVRSDPEEARSLVRASGGLPLALTIMGGYLRIQSYSGQPRRIQAATRRLHDAHERLLLTGPQPHVERSPSQPKDAPVSLQTVIAVGEQQLDEQARQTLHALAIFPSKPHSFSEEAACAICGTPAETLDRLTDAGLLEGSGPERYTLHQIIADYARNQLTDTAPYERMAAYFAAWVEAHARNYEALELESANVFAALEAASIARRPTDLLRGVNALARFLDARGHYAQAEMYLERAKDAAKELGDKEGLAEVLLHLGEAVSRRGEYLQADAHWQRGLLLARQAGKKELIVELLQAIGMLAQRRGDYKQAEAMLQEGLALVRQMGDSARCSLLLKNLGTLEGVQGNYAQAEVYLLEGAALARQADDREVLSQLLLNLGQVASERGEIAQAEALSLEALSLASQIGHREVMSLLLTNLGVLAAERGDFAQAESYLNQGLELARQIGYRERIGLLLTNLGWLSSEQGQYAQAEEYLRESVALADGIGNRWLMTGTLKFLGDVQLKQQQYEAAEATFRQVLELSSEGNQRMMGEAHYGLAMLAAAQGDFVEARKRAEASLFLFEKIGQGGSVKVREWLSALPSLPDSSAGP